MGTTQQSAEILRLFLDERNNPGPFYEKLAALTMDRMPFELEGKHVLDFGSGSGHNSAAMQSRGASVVSIDVEHHLAENAGRKDVPAIVSDGMALAFDDHSFDGVFCSNVIEHVPSVATAFDEMARVVRPGGWAWVSWTNWWSPYGGHDIAPLHLLGTDLGPKVYERFFGRPKKNVPGEGLFPTHIGEVLTLIENHPQLSLVEAVPRYYPSQKWIMKVPGFREFATWNCLLLMERV